MAFKNTDVEVPATLVVDGKTYKDVGVHFRGASSFMMVPEGLKHSSTCRWTSEQEADPRRLRSLNLLNAHEDPTFLRGPLPARARELPAGGEGQPRARRDQRRELGRVSERRAGEQGVHRGLIQDRRRSRWKVPGSPGGRGGLEYLGDGPGQYKRVFEIKSKDDPGLDRARALDEVLNKTPADQLEAALAPILDIDNALRFLAVDNTLVNNDGYWTRASDYSIYHGCEGRVPPLAARRQRDVRARRRTRRARRRRPRR